MDLKDFETLIETLSNLCEAKGFKLACAESCTGGLIAAAMTERAGSSRVFDRGFVTYSNDAKQESLGVPSDILSKFGAVSAECAEAMAFGALKNSQADIALAVTGIAGPSGGSDQKPVGLVFIGIAFLNAHSLVFECRFEGSRGSIRKQSVIFALTKVIEAIEVKG